MSVENPMSNAMPLLGTRLRLALWAIVLLAAVVFIHSARATEAARAWQIYLVNYLFWSGLAVSGVVLVAIWRATNSVWGAKLRGPALATFGFVPLALLGFLPLVIGREHIFPWIHHPKPNRAVWLEPTFLFTRDFLSLLLLYGLCGVYVCFLLRPAAGVAWSGKARGLRGRLVRGWRGAEAESSRADRVLRRLTPPLLVLYALVLSLVAFDLVMSLDPHFVSTLFGGYYFVTNLYMGLALLALLVGIWLGRDPKLQQVITSEELHQLGKLLFGFSMLYGMVFWSQYLVIWYGNLLEEISFLVRRQHEQPWAPLSYTMIFLSLILPFAILLSRPVKKNRRTLAGVGGLILVGMWLERYLLVVPSLWPAGGRSGSSTALLPSLGAASTAGVAVAKSALDRASALPLGLLELAVTAGFTAAFLLSYNAFARAFPITLGLPALQREQGQGD